MMIRYKCCISTVPCLVELHATTQTYSKEGPFYKLLNCLHKFMFFQHKFTCCNTQTEHNMQWNGKKCLYNCPLELFIAAWRGGKLN
jgi:hypothetical protein